jgi:CSLREA domain-containing protein
VSIPAGWASETLDPGSPWPKYEVLELEIPDEVAEGEVSVVELADLDRDHLLDLLVAWQVGDEGVLVAYPGGDREWRREHQRPLMGPVLLARTPAAIRHVAIADMDWDGGIDVIMAVDGRSRLDWFPLAGPRPAEVFRAVTLPGPVTALAAHDYGRRDFAASPVVGLSTAAGPQVALFPDQQAPAAQAPLLVPSEGPVNEILAGNLDGDAWWDLAVATDRGVEILAGTDSASRSAARRISVTKRLVDGGMATGVAIDRFERKTTHGLAVAGPRGLVLADPATNRESSMLKGLGMPDQGGWVQSAWSGVGRGPALITVDADGLRLEGSLELDDGGDWRSAESAILELGGPVALARAGRISRDPVDDLVVLIEGSNHPVLLLAAPRVTYGVTTEDDHDDGTCDGNCTLREAINAANASAGYDVIRAISLTINDFTVTTELPWLTDPVGLNIPPDITWYIRGDSCTAGCFGLFVDADGCGADLVVMEDFSETPGGARGIGLFVRNSYHSWLNNVGGRSNDGRGAYVEDTTDTRLTGWFENNGGHGVHIVPGPGGLSADNHLSYLSARSNGESGIRIQEVPDTMIGGTTGSELAAVIGNTMSGVYISGLAATGTSIAGLYTSDATVQGNGDHAVYLLTAGVTTVGSPITGGENTFDDSGSDGVRITNSTASHQIVNSTIQDNGENGIAILGSSGVEIGPNVISRDNMQHGILIGKNGAIPSNNITVEDSTIGFTGGLPIVPGNHWFGIDIDGGSFNSIGTPGHGNFIADNGWGGIRIRGTGAQFNTVRDNTIGIDQSGLITPGNHGPGVLVVDSPYNVIGGAQGEGNTVTHNEGHGISVTTADAVGVNLRYNSIYDNDGIGIDLGTDGVTPPDPNDADTGPNHLMNQPLILWAESCGGSAWVSGVRDSGSGFFVHDVYAGGSCDPTGWGEGLEHHAVFATTRQTPGRYRFSAETSGLRLGTRITAMTTDFLASSSEFSNCVELTSGRAGDTTADCVFAADDLGGVIRVADDPGHLTPGNPDADGDGDVDADDLQLDVVRVFF